MMQEKKNIDYWTADDNLEWYTRQFREPYRITVAFEKFLAANADLEHKKILDIGCGPGSGTSYLAEKHLSSSFVGMDINTKLFDLYQGTSGNIQFQYGDVFALDDALKNRFDGIISLQTLSWLPEYQRPLEQMCKLNPKWIAFSSLLYEGGINYTISLENYEKPTKESDFSQVYYNIYSVPKIAELLGNYGYRKIQYAPFEIDMDIKKPDHKNLGYYTVTTVDGRRLAFNTCLYQPEGFLFASK